MATPDDLQIHLDAWVAGDHKAVERIVPLVYSEVKLLAKAALRRGGSSGTSSQTTEVTNAALLRAIEGPIPNLGSSAEFHEFMAKVIRNVLVEHARKKRRSPHWAAERIEPIHDDEDAGLAPEVVISLHAALEKLALIAPGQAEIAHLRLFSGLSFKEIGDFKDLSRESVRLSWRAARKFLASHLNTNLERAVGYDSPYPPPDEPDDAA